MNEYEWTEERLEEYFQKYWEDVKNGECIAWSDTRRHIAYEKGTFDYLYPKGLSSK